MTDLSKFLPYIYPALPEVSDMEFIANTRRACIEFCRLTRVWQIDLEPMDIVAGQSNYSMLLPPEADLSKVLTVVVDGQELLPISERLHGNSQGSTGFYNVNHSDKKIILSSIPANDITVGLQISVALQPTIVTFDVPEILFNTYPEAISLGAIANLCAIMGRPFGNLEMAKLYREEFRMAINAATSDASYGFSRAVLNTTPSYI